MIICSGSSNPALAQEISDYLAQPLAKIILKNFSDHEAFCEIVENVRGRDVYVVQSTSAPANDHLMQLLIIIDALRRASAGSITAIMPYFGYARQDRKSAPRTPISAKLVANLIERAGASRVLTLDLHVGQIQGFFDIPTDNLFSAPLFAQDIRERYELDDITLVAPDAGGVARTRAIASRLDVPLAIVDKRRPKPGEAQVVSIVGDVEGKHCIIVDDIADSTGTLRNGAAALLERNAKAVSAYATHGVFSKDAVDMVENSCLESLTTTNSIAPRHGDRELKKIRYLSVGKLIGEATRRISSKESVSVLFK